MSIFDKITDWWDDLHRRRRLSIYSRQNNSEEWYTHISPINIIMALLSSVVLLFIFAFSLVAYSPAMEYLPGFKIEALRSRQNIIENIIKLDSLELLIDNMMLYNNNVSLIMEGRMPVVRTTQGAEAGAQQTKELIPPNEFDSILRSEIESSGRHSLRATPLGGESLMVAPFDGVVTMGYSPSDERFGVEIEATASGIAPVLATKEGFVILAQWSGEGGYIVEILHPDNMISIYQNLSSTTLSRADRVVSGEVIGYSGEEASLQSEEETLVDEQMHGSGAEHRSKILYELWSEGRAVDPEKYIIF